MRYPETRTKERVVAFLEKFQRGRASARVIAHETGIKEATVRDALDDLVRRRRVTIAKHPPPRRWIYQLLYCEVRREKI